MRSTESSERMSLNTVADVPPYVMNLFPIGNTPILILQHGFWPY